MTLAVQKRDGVLFLTLDTPNSRVNIFNLATAEQMLEIMADVTPVSTRAIVLRSAKPTSFMNGVGLMLAQAAHTVDDIRRSAGLVRQAFSSLRNSPVPVIFAVQGTCWGCGVEFLLHSHYRIAATTYDTHFYMTELSDYLFVPVFRSTKHLPETIGLEGAINMLLWGERWSAETAAERGLINEVVPVDGFEQAVDGFVARVLAGKVPSLIARPRRDGVDAELVTRTVASIERLPRDYQRVYRVCLDLLVEAAASDVDETHAERELVGCAESSIDPLGKSAFSFFFIRQMAATRVVGRDVYPTTSLRLVVEPTDNAMVALGQELAQRSLPGVRVSTDAGTTAGDCRLVASSMSLPPPSAVTCTLQFAARRADRAAVALYRLPGTRFIELSEIEPGRTHATVPGLISYLMRAGYQVATSRAGAGFALTELVAGWLAPLVDAMAQGVSGLVLDEVLRAFGVVRQPARWLDGWDSAAVADAVAQHLQQPMEVVTAALRLLQESAKTDTVAVSDDAASLERRIIDGLTLCMLDATLASLDAGFLHITAVDLAAREVLDFPLRYRSLGNYLTLERVAAALQTFAPFGVSAELRARAEQFIARARPFYR